MRISDWSSDVCSSDLIRPGDKILVMSTGRVHLVDKVGVFTPKRKDLPKLGAGEVGWLNASIKDVHGAPVGDTLTSAALPASKPLPGFQDRKSTRLNSSH